MSDADPQRIRGHPDVPWLGKAALAFVLVSGAVLAVVMVPEAVRGSAQARQAICSSNVDAPVRAVLIYAADHDARALIPRPLLLSLGRP